MFGYTDGSGRAGAARLNQLERHIDAWNKLDWVESHIDVPIGNDGLYALRDGTRGLPLRMWTLGFEFPVDEVEIDPSNNLLVVLFRRVSCVHMVSVGIGDGRALPLIA
ncbi:hypothetical protein BS47DRAFT_1486687 [Hydnum rufescens UP504]|uniref:Uncharacterized protein n=1 Tax=Hydnum rufescens UP504 TaxID=1448309 RepID=A0A9P6ATQ2_9AGAM|nr:hypothetical protein BS47DRAFT_1486687 [Hydnum rufescens UP504]